jgi:hypothetical protein
MINNAFYKPPEQKIQGSGNSVPRKAQTMMEEVK